MSDIYLSLTETPSVVTLSQPVVASVMVNTVTVANVVSVNVVTMPAINVTAAGGLTNAELRASAVSVAVTTMPALSISSVSISNFPATQPISGTVTANVQSSQFNPVYSYLVDPNNDQVFATDYPLPISGTVTADLSASLVDPIEEYGFSTKKLAVQLYNTSGIPIGGNDGAPLPISGTVTANLSSPYYDSGNAVTLQRVLISRDSGDGSGDTDIIGKEVNGNIISLPISGTVTANVAGQYFDGASGDTAQLVNPVYYDGEIFRVSPSRPLPVALANGYNFGASVTIGNTVTVAQAAAVTVGQLPRVTFIDGSGSVTTANSAITVFAASTTRSYLLVQVTTGSAFVNVGATATTLNGISLTAGQGYAWETTIPQGLVSLISTTTSSRWVAKEA
jgi:hypothetical protein